MNSHHALEHLIKLNDTQRRHDATVATNLGGIFSLCSPAFGIALAQHIYTNFSPMDSTAYNPDMWTTFGALSALTSASFIAGVGFLQLGRREQRALDAAPAGEVGYNGTFTRHPGQHLENYVRVQPVDRFADMTVVPQMQPSYFINDVALSRETTSESIFKAEGRFDSTENIYPKHKPHFLGATVDLPPQQQSWLLLDRVTDGMGQAYLLRAYGPAVTEADLRSR